MQLESPLILLLLLILPVMAYFQIRRRRTAAVRFSSLTNIQGDCISWRLRLRPLLIIARYLCLALLIIALARPRKGTILQEISTESVAMQIVVDRSGSMQAQMPYKGKNLNRLEVVKEVLSDFIKGDSKNLPGRSGDLIGLITFARYADTACPMVTTYGVLLEFLKKTEIVTLRSEDGTAIGDAIALAAARLQTAEQELKQRKAKLGFGDDKSSDKFNIKSKVIVLLTDGINNAGDYHPLAAAQLAKEWGIKIYTIGVGSSESYTTVQTMFGTYRMPTGQDIDERLLKEIAESTGGFYALADDAKSFLDIVEKIDALEKTDVKSVQYTQYSERFALWTFAALLLLGFEMLAGCTIFRKIP